MKLALTDSIARRIEQQGCAAYPSECCGLLIGIDAAGRRTVTRLVAMKNVFDEKEQYHRFSIDPAAMIEAEKGAAAEGCAVVGFYHSHPDHPARPSEYDRQHVPPWSFYSHVIVAIEKGRPAAMTAWRMNEQTEQFEEVLIENRE